MDKKHKEYTAPGESEKKAPLLPIIIMLFNTAIMWGGFFMLIPLLAVHITQNLLLGASMAGLVLAVRQFIQQSLGFFFGSLSDWFGYRRLMIMGSYVRAAGFAWLAVATEAFGLIMGGVVAALRGALFEASGKAALASISKGYSRASIFSLNSTIGNIGMATGPLIGVALMKIDFIITGFVSASLYIISGTLVWFFVPVIKSVTEQKPTAGAIFSKMGEVFKDTKFVLLTVVMAGFFYLSTQINITITLEAVRLSGSDESVGLVYLINSGLAVTLQFFLIKLLSKRLQPLSIIAIGVVLTTIGIFSFSFANSFALFIVFLVIFSIGRLFVEPVSSAIVVEYAGEGNLASYFGFSSLALAVGGMLGSLTGGWLFDLGYNIGFPALCWVVFGIVGTFVIFGIFALVWHDKRVISAKKIPEAIPVLTKV